MSIIGIGILLGLAVLIIGAPSAPQYKERANTEEEDDLEMVW